MKHLLLLLLSLLTFSISHAGKLTDPGVSRELADYRKATLHELRYALHFDIPAQRTDPVRGRETVRFVLDVPTDVILDFRATPDMLGEVSVNGRAAQVQVKDEHIVIPASATQAGENAVALSFTADGQSLNRRDDLLYTLFVPDRARTVFPCFDQPDLKGRYTLSLTLPREWRAVSNTTEVTDEKTVSAKTVVADGMQQISFAETEPLSTYLFAFAAGRFEVTSYTAADGRVLRAYYRETDPRRIEQLPEIFRQVEFSLKWQEEFTGVPYPFAKYDLVILPGFQFGGMEHTGATFYNDNTIFLSEHPTPDEILSRANLIAHETTHMWFGDYVTMRWFDDVWTKEVFANYFAAEITAPQFPDINHDLNRLKTYAASAMSEDRTWSSPLTLQNGEVLLGGGTAIRQPLDNLRNAGLVYNNIIYNKAPLMMRKLVEVMGRDAFRESIREYVKTYAYGNANWDELVAILDRHSDADIRTFSRAWVDEKGMPVITLRLDDGVLSVTQDDPYGRGILWPQQFDVTLHTAYADTTLHVVCNDKDRTLALPVSARWSDAQIIPNTDGGGYGIFMLDEKQTTSLLHHWQGLTQGTARQATLMNLHELYLLHRIRVEDWVEALIASLSQETDPLTASTICSYLREPLLRLSKCCRHSAYETVLVTMAREHALPNVQQSLIRVLSHYGINPSTEEWMQDLWQQANHPLLSELDMMSLSLELAIRRPADAATIIARQRERLAHPANGRPGNPDRIRQFDFIARACVASASDRAALYQELLTPEGRRIEPWAASALSFLHHHLRGDSSVSDIRSALEALEDVQRTGDIFFPSNWCFAVLGEYLSAAARTEVETFLNAHPDYLVLRRCKILNAAYPLFR